MADPEAPRRILVTKLKQIGDVLLATPAIAALRAEYPSARIWAAVPRSSAEILKGNPDLDRVLLYDRAVVSAVRTALRLAAFRPQWVVQLGLTRRERLLGVLSGGRRRAGFAEPGATAGLTDAVPFDWSRHVVENSAILLERLEVRTPVGPLVLAVTDEDTAWVEQELSVHQVAAGRPLALVHPVTRWGFKSGRDEAMAEVMVGLRDRLRMAVAVTSGPDPAEIARARRILGMAPGATLDFTGRLSLGRLAALMRRARLVVTVDGAPMHMAAALQVPQVALFGPTSEVNWAPWRAPHSIAAAPMPCRPCGLDGCNGCKVSECLLAVLPDQILAAAAALLDRQTNPASFDAGRGHPDPSGG